MKNLLKIVNSGESEKIEFKSNFNEDTIKTLVAFANQKGGSVYIGINDNKQFIGVKLKEETIANWINEIKNKTMPCLIPDVNIINYKNKKIVCLKISEYPVKPVSFKGRYYKRIKNTNHLLDINEVVNLHLKSLNSSWDYYIDDRHSVQDISLDKVYNFIETLNKIKETKIKDAPLTVLKKFDLLRENKITYACYLLFMKGESLLSNIEIGRFQTETIIKDALRIRTDLFTEVEQVINFIKKHINKEYIIDGEIQRKEIWEYPIEAIREIVINAIVHRDYRQASDTLIKIFNDRIEFFNPGKLLKGVTIKEIEKGDYNSVIRNKQIADIFKEAGLIEKYGSGLKRVIEQIKKIQKHRIIFQECENGFKVIIIKTTPKPPQKTTPKTTLKIIKKKQTLEDKILSIIQNNHEVTKKEIAEQLNISINTVKEYIKKLKYKNRLQRIGSNRSGYWKIIK